MGDHFVGRQAQVRWLRDLLERAGQGSRKLVIQSIEGPGGIGKTRLFEHVLASSDLAGRNYLCLRVRGDSSTDDSLSRAVTRLVESADAEPIRGRPAGSYFNSVHRVTAAMDALRRQAISEFKRAHPDDPDALQVLAQVLNEAFALGKKANDVFPETRKHFDAYRFEEAWQGIEERLPTLRSLREEVPGLLGRLGVSASAALRNSLRENACKPLADALVSDLTAILRGYRGKDIAKPSRRKVPGIDRLLLIVDDYEHLQAALEVFLVEHLFPSLRQAGFETVAILIGRDRLETTHHGWDAGLRANLCKAIVLSPLSRSELDELVESYGIVSEEEKQRAWRDTEGYPFCVHLWIEEIESGGRSAVMLKQFYDRTTRWMTSTERDWLQRVLFLDQVNIRTVRYLVDHPEEAEPLFKWFESEGSVRDTRGETFRVREYLRSRLIDYLQISDPDRCEELRARASQANQAAG